MPKLSVIVPVYNVAQYLPQCLDSIINQAFRDIEIICVNDGSTDNSLEILKSYAEKDGRIHIVNKANGGHTSARKAGVSIAKGEYIVFVDSDDWLEVNALSVMYDAMKREKVDCVMCNHYVDDGNTSRKVAHGFAAGRYDKDDLRQIVYPRMIVNGEFFDWGINPSLWGKIFDANLLKRVLTNEDGQIVVGEDAAVVFPLVRETQNIYICPEYLYHYRQNAMSIMKSKFDGEVERKIFAALYRYAQELCVCHEDMRRQWLQYVLFLMIQRADALYDGVENLPYLFPFPNVKKGSDILLYGASTYGQRLYRWLAESKFCNVVAWYDQNAEEFAKQGLPVCLPKDISGRDTKDIVVAVTIAKTRKEIEGYLRQNFPGKRVHLIDVDLILSEETRKAFRLV